MILSTHNLISGIISLLCCLVRIEYNPLFKVFSVSQYILQSTEAEIEYTLLISFLSLRFSIKILLRYAFCSLSKCWHLFYYLLMFWCWYPLLALSSNHSIIHFSFGSFIIFYRKVIKLFIIRQWLMLSNSSLLFSQKRSFSSNWSTLFLLNSLALGTFICLFHTSWFSSVSSIDSYITWRVLAGHNALSVSCWLIKIPQSFFQSNQL